MTKPLKHQAVFDRLVSELHAPWMDDDDKARFNAYLLSQFGEGLDAAIEQGIQNGYSVEEQEAITRALLKRIT